MHKLSLALAGALTLASPALAQSGGQSDSIARSATIVTGEDNTGGRGSVVISRGATGADTITDNSAAGGNASLPERAIPNGSSGGGASGR